MVESMDRRRRDRAYQAVYLKSFKRSEEAGARATTTPAAIAREVADKAAGRMKAPVFRTDEEFADLVGKICTKLGEGQSYYELFGDIPFLATGRIDRMVAVARARSRPSTLRLARAAKRATGLERLSGGVAILLFALALGTIGLWYAIAVGVVVCVASEIYVQVVMTRLSAQVSRHRPRAGRGLRRLRPSPSSLLPTAGTRESTRIPTCSAPWPPWRSW